MALKRQRAEDISVHPYRAEERLKIFKISNTQVPFLKQYCVNFTHISFCLAWLTSEIFHAVITDEERTLNINELREYRTVCVFTFTGNI